MLAWLGRLARLVVALGVGVLAIYGGLAGVQLVVTVAPITSWLIFVQAAPFTLLALGVAFAVWLGSELGIASGLRSQGKPRVLVLAAWVAGSVVLSFLYGAAMFALLFSHLSLLWTEGEQFVVMGLFPAVAVSFAAGFLAGRRAWPGALMDGLLALVVVALDGVVYALGQGTFAAILYQTCPPNERCGIRGRWFYLVVHLPSSAEVSVWLGVTVGLILIATGVLRPRSAGRVEADSPPLPNDGK